MKKLLMLLALFALSHSSVAGVLPDNWSGYISGVLVNESDLGSHVFTERFKGGDEFHWFQKTIKTVSGAQVICEYAVLAKPPHNLPEGLTYCNAQN